MSDNGSNDEGGMNDKRSIGASGVRVRKDIGRQGRPVARRTVEAERTPAHLRNGSEQFSVHARKWKSHGRAFEHSCVRRDSNLLIYATITPRRICEPGAV